MVTEKKIENIKITTIVVNFGLITTGYFFPWLFSSQYGAFFLFLMPLALPVLFLNGYSVSKIKLTRKLSGWKLIDVLLIISIIGLLNS